MLGGYSLPEELHGIVEDFYEEQDMVFFFEEGEL